MYWYENKTGSESLVLSTRVRFARNLEKVPFPARLTPEGREEVWNRVKDALSDQNLMAVPFDGLDGAVKEAYVETRLCSRALGAQGKGSGLLLSRDGNLSLMVCEEDHVRLQIIRTGKEILPSYEEAEKWTRLLEERLPIAFREGLGYLTACPTNLGSAMRISVMMHLSALTRSGKMNALVSRLSDAGFTVRGIFGEGSREGGGIYQISNQMSRDKTPREIALSFEKVIGQVEEWEKREALALLQRDPVSEEDRVFRALGILKNARKISYGEFISLYSALRFGREVGMDGVESTEKLDRLFIQLQPAPLILRDGSLVSPETRDQKRSEILREELN